jgi:hypothetical protein
MGLLTIAAIDSLLDSMPDVLPKQNQLDYYNLGFKGMSYSRNLTLHACPRKFELDAKYAIKKRRNSVTFAYGHAVGEGIQAVLSGESLTNSIVRTVLAYDHDEEDEGTINESAKKKSIWWSVLNVELFYKQYNAGLYTFLDGWEIARFDVVDEVTGETTSRPANELSFVVDCTDGFTYEGHIDLVMFHPVKKKFLVVELKTTGLYVVEEASYKNSAQALGYGIVVDVIARNIKMAASFDVLYLVFKSATQEIVPMLFHKTPAMRAQWLNGIVSDIQFIEQCEDSGYYPHRGESCFNYFRECEYLQTECHMPNSMIERSYGSNPVLKLDDTGAAQFTKMEKPDFFFTIEQLAERQTEILRMASTDLVEADLLLDVTTI